MGKIDTIHNQIITLISQDVTDFNQAFYEKPKTITDEKLPAFAVYYEGHENEITTSRTNKRTYHYAIDIIYDKENIDETQTVTSDLVSQVIDCLESNDNYSLGGNANYTLPTKCTRIEDYQIAGKHYLAYHIVLPVIFNTQI